MNLIKGSLKSAKIRFLKLHNFLRQKISESFKKDFIFCKRHFLITSISKPLYFQKMGPNFVDLMKDQFGRYQKNISQE